MTEAIEHIRQLVWRLCHEAGLEQQLREALEDEEIFQGRPAVVGQPVLTEETAEVATEVLLVHRTGDDPWLRKREIDLDDPVFYPGFVLPPGLVFQEPSNALRARILNASGAARLMVPSVHFPASTPPWHMRQRLTFQEVWDYLEHHGF